jgi:hypothetical protein
MRRLTAAVPVLAIVIAALACSPAQAAITHSWHADGDTVDAVGTANGTLNNGATFAAGLAGQAFSLDGTDDTVTFGTTAGNVGSGDFTIAFAIRMASAGQHEAVLTKRAVCNHGSFVDIHSGASGTIGIELDQDGLGTNHSSVGSLDRIDDGVFHTAVVTRQGQVLTWFIDGVVSGSDGSVPAADVSNTAALTLGNGPCVGADGLSVQMGGKIDELRIADTADPNLLPPPVPMNLTAPSIPASATEGDALTCQGGDWRYHPTLAYQWLRDGQPIGGATSASYTATSADVGKTLVCRVTGTNSGGSGSADSNAVVPKAKPPEQQQNPPTTPSVPVPAPAVADQTVRGEQAFSQGTSNDLYLACTKLDLLLIDVLPAGPSKVSVTGTADLRLAGATAEILLDGRRVGTAPIGADGSFATRVAAPAATRRKNARYQARVGTTSSQKLKLERRMAATSLTREGSFLVLRGKITKPFATKPAQIQVERFLSCQRQEIVKTAQALPSRGGTFAVRIPLPSGANAAIYRALTKVARHPRGPATAHTFTLPRAIDLI